MNGVAQRGTVKWFNSQKRSGSRAVPADRVNGIHEVSGSIALGSTNKINNLEPHRNSAACLPAASGGTNDKSRRTRWGSSMDHIDRVAEGAKALAKWFLEAGLKGQITVTITGAAGKHLERLLKDAKKAPSAWSSAGGGQREYRFGDVTIRWPADPQS
jgi:hypothetical protein